MLVMNKKLFLFLCSFSTFSFASQDDLFNPEGTSRLKMSFDYLSNPAEDAEKKSQPKMSFDFLSNPFESDEYEAASLLCGIEEAHEKEELYSKRRLSIPSIEVALKKLEEERVDKPTKKIFSTLDNKRYLLSQMTPAQRACHFENFPGDALGFSGKKASEEGVSLENRPSLVPPSIPKYQTTIKKRKIKITLYQENFFTSEKYTATAHTEQNFSRNGKCIMKKLSSPHSRRKSAKKPQQSKTLEAYDPKSKGKLYVNEGEIRKKIKEKTGKVYA